MKALLILNPAANSGKQDRQLKRIRRMFQRRKHVLDIVETTKPNDATRIAKGRKKAYDVIIAGGGDGTINEVINGLAYSSTPLGIIPLGTENVLAQELRIPRNPVKAARRILRCRERCLDLGRANKRYFILMTGIGFDAHVASSVDPLLKKALGSTAYPLTAIKSLFEYDSHEVFVQLDKNTLTRGYFVMVGNSKGYGGRIDPAYNAKLDDGLLDVLVFKSKHTFNMLRYYFGFIFRLHTLFPDVEYRTAKEIRITSKKPVIVHTDCEILGTTPVTITVCPKALRIFC
ncbi:diacylglycerol kinase family lipid kinase [Candidatus Woesearchaeota archaeon]|nr:diacylglycerol kinase family lipid kinase [Candidatus Woesearchaeota archaeon]